MSEYGFDFEAFLARMMDVEHPGLIIQAAERECNRAEGGNSRGRVAPAARAAGAYEYARQLKNLLYFLRFGQKPGGVGHEDWAQIRVLIRKMVDRGVYKPEALDI